MDYLGKNEQVVLVFHLFYDFQKPVQVMFIHRFSFIVTHDAIKIEPPQWQPFVDLEPTNILRPSCLTNSKRPWAIIRWIGMKKINTKIGES